MPMVDLLEALLFVSEAPVTLKELATVCGASAKDVHVALEELRARMDDAGGLRLIELAGGFQICTKEKFAEPIARFLKPGKRRLGKSALEALAIVAYRQPMTLSEIDAVRGVQSDYALRTLVEKGLVEEVGRKQTPGRPILYGTTRDFLHQFNLASLDDLPPMEASEEAAGVGV
jgi:segregation and condensation protein B